MKAFIVLVSISVALGAPTNDGEEIQRIKKSYGAYAKGPCAGATSLAPVAVYLSPQSASIALDRHRRQDREHEHTEELNEHARSYYGPAAPGLSPGLSAPALPALATSAIASPPAVGLFPNAKIGGCAVPLLLSCAPSVHSGHLAHAAPAYSAPAYAAPAIAAPPAYRTDADHKLRETAETQWTEAARQAAPDMDSHHHHLVAVDFHSMNHVQS